jgi:hypothetical protein
VAFSLCTQGNEEGRGGVGTGGFRTKKPTSGNDKALTPSTTTFSGFRIIAAEHVYVSSILMIVLDLHVGLHVC